MLFKYGKPVTGNYFYDRSGMRKRVSGFLKSKQSFMIKAPRRYGKTSIVLEELREIDPDHLYVNLQMYPRTELLAEKIANYAFTQAGYRGFFEQLRKNVATLLREIRSIGLESDFFTATVEFYADTGRSGCEQLVKALETLDAVAKRAGRTLYVVFDEFQEVSSFACEGDILNLLRSAMQMHENVCYVFLGSKPTMMTTIFENKKSPFYNFCRKLVLEPFDIEELHKEVIAAFKSIQVVFEDEGDLKALLARTEGHPANTMLVLQNLERLAMAQSVKLVKKKMIEKAYEEAYDEMQDLIAEYLNEIRRKEHLHDVLYREAVGQKQTLSSPLLAQKRKTLEEMGFLEKKERGQYRIVDGFLKETFIRLQKEIGQ